MVQQWFNNDKLLIKYGTDAGTATKVGAYEDPAPGGRQVIEFELLLTDLTSTATTILFDNIAIPYKAWIEKIEIINVVVVTSAGSGATLNLGLMKFDRTTALSSTGLVNAAPQANYDVVNETQTITVVASGQGGSLLGTAIASPSYITGFWGTEAFTAGKVKVRIIYRLDANVKGSDNG